MWRLCIGGTDSVFVFQRYGFADKELLSELVIERIVHGPFQQAFISGLKCLDLVLWGPC